MSESNIESLLSQGMEQWIRTQLDDAPDPGDARVERDPSSHDIFVHYVTDELAESVHTAAERFSAEVTRTVGSELRFDIEVLEYANAATQPHDGSQVRISNLRFENESVGGVDDQLASTMMEDGDFSAEALRLTDTAIPTAVGHVRVRSAPGERFSHDHLVSYLQENAPTRYLLEPFDRDVMDVWLVED